MTYRIALMSPLTSTIERWRSKGRNGMVDASASIHRSHDRTHTLHSADLDHRKSGHMTDVSRLWGAVILQALRDALWRDPDPDGPIRQEINRGTRVELTRIRDEATIWLLYDREGFAATCDLAGIEWERVRKLARRVLESGIAPEALPQGILFDDT